MPPPSRKDWVSLGQINFRGIGKTFGIKRSDRRYHMYLIGQTGTGKTTLLENLVRQDIDNQEGLAVLDPHGDMVQHLVRLIPEERKKDLIYFNVPDPSCPYGFNPLEAVPSERRALAASEMIEAFKRIWEKTWGPRMEHILRNVLLTLLEQPKSSLADVNRLFTDEPFRKQAITRLTNPEVRDFWQKEFAMFSFRFRSEIIQPIQNKVGAFLSDPTLYRVLTCPQETFDVRKVMDEGKILLVNLSKGRLGSDNSSLLGSLLVSRIGLGALSRADQEESVRRDFYLYLDEFQNFTTYSMVNILSELRKYHLDLVMANQYLAQLEEEIREAVLGNVGNIIVFRVGLNDARVLEKVFYPDFFQDDLINLHNFNIYLRLMIDGTVSKPFSAVTLPSLSIGGLQVLAWLRTPLAYLVRWAIRRWGY